MNCVTCSGCGLEIQEQPLDTDRVPCPRCGSVARTFTVEAGVGAYAVSGGSAVVSFSTYPQQLITLAERLLRDNEFSMSVVVAHLAAEVAAGRKLTDAFVARGIPDLEEAVTALFSGSNLTNERIRKLYTALTGDDIGNEPFWSDFRSSAQLRNRIAHAGSIASQSEAERAIAAASAVIKHLGKWGSTA